MITFVSARVALGLVAGMICFPIAASAQQCLGFPTGSRGFLTFGFEGTDGATGEGLGFGYQTSGVGILLQGQSLDDFTVIDELETIEARVSYRPVKTLPICVLAGIAKTAYHSEQELSRSGREPGYVDERHIIGGPYRRLRVPVGIGIGREFFVGPITLVPYFTPALVYESETHILPNAPGENRHAWGVSGNAGITLVAGWMVVRSSLSHAVTHEYALSSKHNFPLFTLHAGVRF